MKKLIGIIIFTIAEFAALVGWLALVLSNRNVLGIVVLAAGLILEHFLSFRTLVGKKFPVLRLAIISISESAIWIVWLILARSNPIAGFVFLVVAMFFQHSIERNVFNGKGFFDDLIKGEVVLFTIVEAIAAALWLNFVLNNDNLVGALILAAGLLVEHLIQSRQ